MAVSISLTYVNTTIAGFFIIAIFLYFVGIRLRSSKHRLAPEAAGGWPIIGHLLLFAKSNVPHITLGALADKYGPVFRIRIGMHAALVLSTWEVAKECFTVNDLALASRPKQIAAENLGYNYVMFGFAPYGPYWREIRKIITLELLSNRRLELLRHVKGSEVESSIKELFNIWSKKNGEDSTGNVLVEMKKWFADLNLNVSLRMVAGKKFSGASDEQEARRCQKAFREFFHFLSRFAVGDAITFLRWFDFDGYEKTTKRIGKDLDDIATGWLEEHKRERYSGKPKEEQDLMDVMLSTLNSSNLSGHDADLVIKATCLVYVLTIYTYVLTKRSILQNLVSGGVDTTLVGMTWALALILNNPHVLRKAQDELDAHVGKERLVNESDISNLVYLQAIFKEALRLYPPGPLGGAREVTKECTIGGYHVPVGTQIFLNVWKIQTDPRVWSDPLEFKPERFVSTHKDFDVKGQHFELVPFGGGRRACPGITFALQMAHLALASLLQAFEISTPTDCPVDMTGTFGLTFAKTTPLEVLLKPRLPHFAYT